MEDIQPGKQMALMGIDIGTTHCKVGIYTIEGVLIRENEFATPATKYSNGWAQYDCEELWVLLEKCIMAAAADSREQVEAIGVSSQGESCVLTDQDFRPLTSGIPWYDNRTEEYTEWWRGRIRADQIYRITGLELQSIYTVMKLQWLKEHEREAYDNACCFHCMSDYIAGRMTGRHGISYSMASRTMALDLKKGVWSDEILKIADIRKSIFPALIPQNQSLGILQRGLSKKWGFEEKCSVSIAGFDHMAGCLGVGAASEDQVVASIGTTESVCLTEQNLQAMGKEYYGYLWGFHALENRYYSIGGIPAGGQTIDWAVKTFIGIESADRGYRQFEKLCQSAPVLSNGVLFLPHLFGCCVPVMDNHSKGAFYGLSKETSSADMARAVIEGLCMEFRLVLEKSKKKNIKEIIAIGGGVKNKFWMQCKADVLGIAIRVKSQKDAVTLGNVMIAARNGNIKDAFEDTLNSAREDKLYIPNQKNHEKYEAVYQRLYSKLYFNQKEVNDTMRLIVKEGGEKNGTC